MAGRGTDILLGGNAKGIARTITKYLLLYSLKLFDMPVNTTEAALSVYVSSDTEEPETDPDVLALPATKELCDYLEIQLPQLLTPSVELALKRAVISCVDMISASIPTPSKLDVEDLVARASDASPATDVNIRRLRLALESVTTSFEETLKREKEEVMIIN